MSRASLVLILILLAIVAGLVWLSRRGAGVPLHPIAQTVTPNGSDAAQH